MRENQEEPLAMEWVPDFLKTTAYSYIYSVSSTLIAI